MASSWNLERAHADSACSLGESIAETLGVTSPPVDPLFIVDSEQSRIRAFGDDFGDAFDGRLEYQKPSFLLFYNTKYDRWSHTGQHHPKVLFTVAHELGHYFLESHRAYLMRGGGPHGSFTEFVSDGLPEREADAFATGLLMPGFLLRRLVNSQPPRLEAIKDAREAFFVSLTSMLVRWIQLCDFPCAMAMVKDHRIEWGFTSDGFKRVGGHNVQRGANVSSRSAQEFLGVDPSLTRYRESESWSIAGRWIELDRPNVEVHEHFIAIPSTQQLLVFLTANEDEVAGEDD